MRVVNLPIGVPSLCHLLALKLPTFPSRTRESRCQKSASARLQKGYRVALESPRFLALGNQNFTGRAFGWDFPFQGNHTRFVEALCNLKQHKVNEVRAVNENDAAAHDDEYIVDIVLCFHNEMHFHTKHKQRRFSFNTYKRIV